jgi:D-alanine-D-alanine ligase
MRIGITYDLREDYLRDGYDPEQAGEFDEVETIEAIERALHHLGHETDRIGGAQPLIARLAKGDRWELVFNIAEGMHGFGRQALVPTVLDSYRIPYTFSDPLALCVTLHKATAKRVVHDLGIATPDFAVVESMADIDQVSLAYPQFIKPVAEGTSKGITAASKVHDLAELRLGCTRLLERFRQPVLVETFLPGREFTVGILGTGDLSRALGVMEIAIVERSEAPIYDFSHKKRYEHRVEFRLAKDAEAATAGQLALDIWKCLGCRDAGRVDLRSDADGRPHFLEANPLAGLHPQDSDLMILGRLKGKSHAEIIRKIMDSALQRTALYNAGRL